MRVTYIFIAFILSLSLFSQEVEKAEINWLSVDEAIKKTKEHPKKILIDFYTNWCGPCRKMSNNTFKDPNIVNYINTNYYAVKFNAEGSDSCLFDSVIYKNPNYDPAMKNGRNSTHELTKLLARANNKIAYPTVVYLDEELKVISAVPGYFEPKRIQPILIYFAENIHKLVPFDNFNIDFNKTFYDTTKIDTVKIEWYSLDKAVELCKDNPKKILVHVHSDWSLTSKIMLELTYEHPVISKYIAEKFYTVAINAFNRDTVVFNGNTFYNDGKKHPYNQFAATLLNGKMNFPSNVYINNDLTIITAVPGYQAPVNFEPIMKYFAEDHYLTKNWQKYFSEFKSEIIKVE